MNKCKMILVLQSLLCLYLHVAAGGELPITIRGQLAGKGIDTINMYFFPEKFGLSIEGSIIERKPTADGSFVFTTPAIRKPAYVILKSRFFNANRSLHLGLDTYLVEPGDSIYITVDQLQHLHFEGRGAEKYRLRYAMDTLASFMASQNHRLITLAEVEADISNELTPSKDHSIMDAQLNLLDLHKSQISPLVYDIIKCDLLCSRVRTTINWYGYRWPGAFQLPDSVSRKRKLIDFFNQEINIDPPVSSAAKAISAKYPDLVIIKTMMAEKIESNRINIPDCWPWYEKVMTSNDCSDRIIVSFLLHTSKIGGFKHYDSCFTDALSRVKDPDNISLLMDFIAHTQTGQPAFAFTLPDNNDHPVSLSDFTGKVVFIDFWFTGCGACLVNAMELKNVIRNFAGDSGVVFMTISVDRERQMWKKTLDQDSYASTRDEINLYTNGQGDLHPLIRHYSIDGYPFFLLVGRDGRIISASPPRPNDRNGVSNLTALINEAKINNNFKDRELR